MNISQKLLFSNSTRNRFPKAIEQGLSITWWGLPSSPRIPANRQLWRRGFQVWFLQMIKVEATGTLDLARVKVVRLYGIYIKSFFIKVAGKTGEQLVSLLMTAGSLRDLNYIIILISLKQYDIEVEIT
jgi:hypothetical protein